MIDAAAIAAPPVFAHSGAPTPKSADAPRIVQVETFYQPYLDGFYAARPELAAAPHAAQINALIGDGFSALHNIAPYLEPLGWDAHFIVANCAQAQRAWLRDHQVSFPPGTQVGFAEALRAQIDALDPDVLYFSDATSFGADFVRSLRRRPRLVVAWHAAPIPPGVDWSEVDLFLSGLSAMRTAAGLLGARSAERYMPGAPEWLPSKAGDADEAVDFLFTGSYTSVQHARRNALLEALADHARACGASCALHMTTPAAALPPSLAGFRRDAAFGVDMQRLLTTGRIVFDARSDMTGAGPDGALYDVAGRETANMRLFEATAAGSFLLTERWNNVGDYFTPGVEVETFAGAAELLEKARYYLSRPDERRAIAAAGRRRCMEEHGMRKRAPLFDALIRRRLPNKPQVAVNKPSVRRYCTYFDGDYAPRGLAMIDSVRRFTPDARFTVLCLDDRARRIVADRRPDVRIVALEELEAFDPQLAAVKQSRSRFEYYFTCTPCLPRFALHLDPDADSITYLDADLFFYRSPEEVFAMIGAASIAVAPHRFTPALAPGRIAYGRYNVGWVTWRNDAVGRRCLEEYRADCLEWCFDRLEGDRFADQKYLDAWPKRYGGAVRELTSKGVNLALWNVDDCTLSRRDDVIYADDDPLIFVHFHGVKHVGPVQWDVRFREYGVVRNHPFLLDELYRPYLTLLQRAFDELAAGYGLTVPGDPRQQARAESVAAAAGAQAGTASPAPAPPSAVPSPAVPSLPAPAPASGVVRYQVIDRETAARLAAGDGWNFDDVAARQDAAFAELLAALNAGKPRLDFQVAAAAAAATGMVRPSLLEVGCASGYVRHVFDRLVPGGVDYAGVDKSQALIDLARRNHPGVRFDAADAAALPYPDASVDVVFNGVALMHIVDYEAAVVEARRVARRWCVFHTTPVLQRRPTTFLAKEAYGRPVAEVIVNEAELRLLFARNGLAVRKIWESIPYDLSPVLGEPTPTRTFLCEVVDPVDPARPALLNVGCGVHFHTDWANIDVQPRAAAVMGFDARNPLPYPDACFDMVYHSHVLEHLPRAAAPGFIADCRRTLKPGGVLRIAVPDLEGAAREYLRQMEAADAGDAAAAARYDWILLELIDQIGRHRSGGDMKAYLSADPLPAEDYVLSRVGEEARGLIAGLRAQRRALGGAEPPAEPEPSDEAVGRFRRSGETHLWMYDRYSLRRLLEDSGMTGCRVVAATESALPAFAGYGLDALPDGAPRKPDSLFMEARKPA